MRRKNEKEKIRSAFSIALAAAMLFTGVGADAGITAAAAQVTEGSSEQAGSTEETQTAGSTEAAQLPGYSENTGNSQSPSSSESVAVPPGSSESAAVSPDSSQNPAAGYIVVELDGAENSVFYAAEPNGSVELKVKVKDAADWELTYQWQQLKQTESAGRYEVIEGATGPSYTVPSVSERTEYICSVRGSDGHGNDGYGSVWCVATVKTNLTASVDRPHGDNYYSIKPNESVELKVKASSSYGELTYQWKREKEFETWICEDIEGATSSSYTVLDVTKAVRYFCEVSDGYASQTVWCCVLVETDLKAEPDSPDDNLFYTEPNGSVELKVKASTSYGELTYQWKRQKQLETGGWIWENIEGATGPAYTVSDVTEDVVCYCEVRDGYKSRDVWCCARVKTDLSVEKSGQGKRFVPENESITLNVNASSSYGPLTYQWYKKQGRRYYEIEGATQPVYTVMNVTDSEDYECRVQDEYCTAWAYYQIRAVDASGFAYRKLPDGETVEIVGYAGEAAEPVIPEEIDGKKVVRIGKWAFRNNSRLAGITIPAALSEIGDAAFQSCTNLKGITVDSGSAAFVSENGVLYNKEKTTLLCWPAGKEGKAECPSGVSVIGAYAFAGCRKLDRVELPETVVRIERSAFRYCRGMAYIKLPESLTEIGAYAFYKCSGLTYIDLPESVTEIGVGAFYECRKLKQIRIPSGVRYINGSVFYGCKKLSAIELPSEMYLISNNAFGLCDGLKDVYFTGSEAQWDALGMGGDNNPLLAAAIHYNTSAPALPERTSGEAGHTVHTWDGGKVTAAATCTASGVKTYTCTVCGSTKTEEIAASGVHTWDGGKVTAATCAASGVTTYTCTSCGTTKQETINKTDAHTWGGWTDEEEATVFAPKTRKHICSVCKAEETEEVGEKLKSVMKLNAEKLTLRAKQTSSALAVSGLANGDSVVSVESNNTKILKVAKFTEDGGITLKAQNKTGSAKLTITLAGGTEKTITVKVQKAAVKTTKISGVPKKLALKKGQKVTLKPVITPLTSQEKVTYTTSKKKVAAVTNKGVVTAKAKGTARITVKSGSKKAVVTVNVK